MENENSENSPFVMCSFDGLWVGQKGSSVEGDLEIDLSEYNFLIDPENLARVRELSIYLYIVSPNSEDQDHQDHEDHQGDQYMYVWAYSMDKNCNISLARLLHDIPPEKQVVYKGLQDSALSDLSRPLDTSALPDLSDPGVLEGSTLDLRASNITGAENGFSQSSNGKPFPNRIYDVPKGVSISRGYIISQSSYKGKRHHLGVYGPRVDAEDPSSLQTGETKEWIARAAYTFLIFKYLVYPEWPLESLEDPQGCSYVDEKTSAFLQEFPLWSLGISESAIKQLRKAFEENPSLDSSEFDSKIRQLEHFMTSSSSQSSQSSRTKRFKALENFEIDPSPDPPDPPDPHAPQDYDIPVESIDNYEDGEFTNAQVSPGFYDYDPSTNLLEALSDETLQWVPDGSLERACAGGWAKEVRVHEGSAELEGSARLPTGSTNSEESFESDPLDISDPEEMMSEGQILSRKTVFVHEGRHWLFHEEPSEEDNNQFLIAVKDPDDQEGQKGHEDEDQKGDSDE